MPRYCATMLILNSKMTSETTLVESSLTHIKTATKDYYVDNMNRRQGESKSYHNNGKVLRHCFYLNDQLHGEYKKYHDNGKLFRHCFYIKGRNVKKEVELVVEDVFDITDEEKVILKLQLGLEL